MASIDVRAIGSHLTSTAWVAQKTFFGTLFLAFLAGVVLAVASYYFLRDLHWVYGLIAVAAALVESLIAGVMLGAKRGIAMAVVQSLEKLQLGRVITHSAFDKMLGVTEGNDAGERGHVVTKAAERVPLAQANEKLHAAIVKLTGEAQGAGWLRRKIQAWLMDAVEKFTLAQFRDENAQHGGVDLVKVRDELERRVDQALVERVRGGVKMVTMLVMIGLPLLVAVQTWALRGLKL
jgi:hypothetical protein